MHAIAQALRTAACGLALLLSLACPAEAATAPPPRIEPAIAVQVDARVEIAATMARLAGLEEYQARGIAAYDRAVDAHFAPYRAHPSIEALRRLRESRGVGYNAIVEAALASAPVTWAPALPLAPWPATLDPRWDAASLREFQRAASAFERDTGARAFFASQAAIQSRAEASIRANLEGRLEPGWYDALRPCAGIRRFVVVPGLLDGLNSYSVRIGDTVYGVLATPAFGDGDAIAYPADPQLALLVHEFHHACTNPWVDANADALMPAATRTYEVVRDRLRALAYTSPRILLYETLVRANTLRYLRQHGEDAGFARLVDEDEGKGFPWTPALADVLDADARDDGGFGPATAGRVAALLDDWARDGGARIADAERRREEARAAALARGPQLERLVPAHGAKVGAGEATLELHFDRTMDGRIAIFGDVPKIAGKPAWDEGKRVLRIPVVLEAGVRYGMRLNGDGEGGFASADGERLAPRDWSFEVEPAAP